MGTRSIDGNGKPIEQQKSATNYYNLDAGGNVIRVHVSSQQRYGTVDAVGNAIVPVPSAPISDPTRPVANWNRIVRKGSGETGYDGYYISAGY